MLEVPLGLVYLDNEQGNGHGRQGGLEGRGKKAQHARDMDLELSHREESKGIRERERQSDARHAALGM